MSFTCILGLFWITLVLLPLVSAICWFPDGSPAAQDTPCTSDGLTTCCGQGYACLSNRICKATGEEIRKPGASLYVRGSCTDKSWNNPNCPLFCVISDIDNVSGGQGIGKCVNTSSDIYYCINPRLNQVNCNSKQNVLLFQGSPTTITVIGVTSVPSTSITSSTSSAISSTVATANITSTSPASGATGEATQPVVVKSHRDRGIGIGVGVGCGSLAVALVAIATYFLRKRRRKSGDTDINFTPTDLSETEKNMPNDASQPKVEENSVSLYELPAQQPASHRRTDTISELP